MTDQLATGGTTLETGRAIASLLGPRRIAVIGATANPAKVGGRVVTTLRAGGFTGEVIEVNPGRVAEAGVLGSLDELDEPVDVSVVALPSGRVAGALAGAESLTRNVVVLSAGYQETGDRITPAARADLARFGELAAGGVGVLGPNCNGYYVRDARAVVSFAPVLAGLVVDESVPRSGVVMLSQSGAYGARFASACSRRGVPLDGYFNTGNESGFKVGSLLGHVAREMDGVRAAVLYLEGVRDLDDLLVRVEEATRNGIRVLALTTGSSEKGRLSAQSHTAALAPPAKVLRDLLEYAGAVVLDDDAQLLDDIVAAGRLDPVTGGSGLGVLTVSGGAGVMVADRCERHGLSIPELTASAQDEVARHLPPFAAVSNPVDMTGQPMPDRDYHLKAATAMVADGSLDLLLTIIPKELVPGVARAVRPRVGTAAILLDGTTEELAELSRGGVAAFSSVKAAVDAMAHVRVRQPQRRTLYDDPPVGPAAALTVHEALCAVAEGGIATPATVLVDTVEDAAARAVELGWPITLKANASDSSVHKRDAGLLRLGLMTPEAVRVEAAELLARSPQVLVQAQVSPSAEIIVGARHVPGAGPVIVIGLGGGLAEALALSVTLPGDADCPSVPLDLQAGPTLLRTVPAIAEHWPTLLGLGRRLAALCGHDGYDSVEVNPVALTGAGAVALDARFVVRSTSG